MPHDTEPLQVKPPHLTTDLLNALKNSLTSCANALTWEMFYENTKALLTTTISDKKILEVVASIAAGFGSLLGSSTGDILTDRALSTLIKHQPESWLAYGKNAVIAFSNGIFWNGWYYSLKFISQKLATLISDDSKSQEILTDAITIMAMFAVSGLSTKLTRYLLNSTTPSALTTAASDAMFSFISITDNGFTGKKDTRAYEAIGVLVTAASGSTELLQILWRYLKLLRQANTISNNESVTATENIYLLKNSASAHTNISHAAAREIGCFGKLRNLLWRNTTTLAQAAPDTTVNNLEP